MYPAVLRSNSTDSGNTPAPTTVAIATAAKITTPMDKYEARASPAARSNSTEAHPARRTVSRMAVRLSDGLGPRERSAPAGR
ncbi:hypothetical protein GCM10022420_026880 [Streptomyces iranensis]